jgi:hypothetical protein
MPVSRSDSGSGFRSVPRSEELLLAFYTGDGCNVQGRTYSEILAWSDAVLEAVHDYIQWLFPLPEASAFNPLAPVLTPALIEAFRNSEALRSRLRAAWLRMLAFYGFTLEHHEQKGQVVPSASFPQRAGNWLTPHNHNHLRLTRILRSLHLLGLEQESLALFAALETVYKDELQGQHRITPETFEYWQRATQ